MTRSTLSITVLLVAAALLCWFVPQALLVGFAGALMGIGLRALAAPLAVHTRLGSGWAVLVVAALLAAVLALGAWAAAGPLTQQARSFADSLPATLRALRDRLSDYPWAQSLVSSVDPEKVLPSAGEAASYAMLGLSGTIGAVGNLVLAVLLALYFASAPSTYRRGFTALLAPELRPRGMETLHAVGHALKGWLQGALISMLFSGLMTFTGLWLLGVPLPGLLGAITALFGFIPYIGPLLSAIPAALVVVGHDPSLLPWAMAVYFATQVLEGNLVTPMVQKQTSDLAPALLLMAQTVMGLLSGLLGVALAAPIAVAIVAGVRTAYVEGRLEDAAKDARSGSTSSERA